MNRNPSSTTQVVTIRHDFVPEEPKPESFERFKSIGMLTNKTEKETFHMLHQVSQPLDKLAIMMARQTIIDYQREK